MLHVMQDEERRLTSERIWRELSDRLRQFVRSRLDSPADVDDVLQTVFLRIHSKLGELRDANRLEAWVFQITRNALTDHFRKAKDVRNDVDQLTASPTGADQENSNAEIAGCLRVMIEQLPDDQRRALSLYELQGVSQKEIAERESISVSGAKSRIQRGRKNLEQLLRECCELHFDRRGNIVDFKPNQSGNSDIDCE